MLHVDTISFDLEKVYFKEVFFEKYILGSNISIKKYILGSNISIKKYMLISNILSRNTC